MTINDMLWVLVGMQFAALLIAGVFLLYCKRELRRLIADSEAAEQAIERRQERLDHG